MVGFGRKKHKPPDFLDSLNLLPFLLRSVKKMFEIDTKWGYYSTSTSVNGTAMQQVRVSAFLIIF
jgi:hypothetical protein